MNPDIAFGVVLGRLLDAVEPDDFRQDLAEEAGAVQQLEGTAGMAFGEHAGELIAHAFAADLGDAGSEVADGALGFRLDGVFEAGREANDAQHAELVFFEAAVRVADGADDPVAEIALAADVVEERGGEAAGLAMQDGIEHHAVDGEVAAEDVFAGARGEADFGGMAAVEISDIAAKGGDFGEDFAAVDCVADEDDAELGADGKGAGEQRQDGVGMRAGGHVKVFGLDAEEEVAHAAAGEIRLVAGGAEALHDAFGGDLRGRGGHGPGTFYYRDVSPGSSGLILGIETSCDETAAAVVRRGSEILSNVVASQIPVHAPYGGVVPELASREHLRNVLPVVRSALEQAGVGFEELDAIAVTEGPGLAGALLVGISFAKALAYALGKPLIAVNHLEGHIHAVLLEEARRRNDGVEAGSGARPGAGAETILALVVSGGHTHLYLAQREEAGGIGSWTYRNVGRTVDDAAGEAFDKVAKVLGLGYPGGPWIDGLAPHGNPEAVPFSFSQIKAKAHRRGEPGALDPRQETYFSFSGIKTAVLRYVHVYEMEASIEARRKALAELPEPKPEDALARCDRRTLDLIASFQRSVVDDLRRKTFRAAETFWADRVMVSGGVAANRELRVRFTAEAGERHLPIAFPSIPLATDNAAMIAAAAWPRLAAGEVAPEELTAEPGLALGR